MTADVDIKSHFLFIEWSKTCRESFNFSQEFSSSFDFLRMKISMDRSYDMHNQMHKDTQRYKINSMIWLQFILPSSAACSFIFLENQGDSNTVILTKCWSSADHYSCTVVPLQ